MGFTSFLFLNPIVDLSYTSSCLITALGEHGANQSVLDF